MEQRAFALTPQKFYASNRARHNDGGGLASREHQQRFTIARKL